MQDPVPGLTAGAPPPLHLLHDDQGLVAVDKPPGLLVHPSALDAHAPHSVTALLRERLGARLLPLHRLDRGTSGVLLLARDAAAARAGRAAFDARLVRKRYLALVRGWPPAHGEIDHPLARDPERPSAGQTRLPALTRYATLARFEWPFATHPGHAASRYALVLAEPVTGRRHQIRRHFKHAAHPVVGDATHGKGAHNRAVAAFLGASRLWLHALSVALPWNGATLRVAAACGPEWAPLLGSAGGAGAPGMLEGATGLATDLADDLATTEGER